MPLWASSGQDPSAVYWTLLPPFAKRESTVSNAAHLVPSPQIRCGLHDIETSWTLAGHTKTPAKGQCAPQRNSHRVLRCTDPTR